MPSVERGPIVFAGTALLLTVGALIAAKLASLRSPVAAAHDRGIDPVAVS
jgi:hypothetical protein